MTVYWEQPSGPSLESRNLSNIPQQPKWMKHKFLPNCPDLFASPLEKYLFFEFNKILGVPILEANIINDAFKNFSFCLFE